MKKTWKKALSALLTLAMVLSVAPVTVMAGDVAVATEISVSTSDALVKAIEEAGDSAVTIKLAGGKYKTNVKVPGGKNITITGSKDAVLSGQIATTSSTEGKLTIEGVTYNVTDIEDSTGISQTGKSAIAIWGNQTVICKNVTFNMSVADTTAITSWWDTGIGTTIECYDCVFNCGGQRPIRATGNVTVVDCDFNDPYRYAVQLTAKASTATELDKAIINFNNNTIVNGENGKAFVYGIQLEGSDYGCNNLIINGKGNTIENGGDDSTMYFCECGKVDHASVFWNVEEAPLCDGKEAAVAKISYADGDAYFATLKEAVAAAAESGDTIELLTNVTFDNINDLDWSPCKSNGNGNYGKEKGNGGFIYVVGKDITFDLNGHSIIYDLHDEEWCNKHVLSVFYVTDQGKLTITDSSNGKGKVEVNGMATAVYSVAAGTEAIIEGGTWTWNPCKECEATNIFLHASHGGELYIKDGYFENNAVNDSAYMIVEHGSSKETTANSAGVDYDETKVEISGGDYKNYDPSKSMFIDQGNGGAANEKDCCADGYVSTLLKDGITYRVHKEGTEAEPADPKPSTSSKKSSKKYDVEIEDTEDGTVKASSTRVKRGATVTLTVTPDDGYELDEIVVLDSDGDEIELKDKGNGKFTFTMPRGDVEVEASFEEADEKEPVVDEKEEPADEDEFIRLTIGQKIVWLFDEYVVNDVAPEIRNERTMLPIRIIAEALGATVTWNEAEQKVTITEDDLVIEIFIGQPFATVNGEPVQLDAPAYIANDRTYLPLRFVAENLGATVEWNATDSTVTIYE